MTCQHLTYHKRLSHIIVGAYVQPHHLVVLLAERGTEYDGSKLRGRIIAHTLGKVEPADVFHHYVHHNRTRAAERVSAPAAIVAENSDAEPDVVFHGLRIDLNQKIL